MEKKDKNIVQKVKDSDVKYWAAAAMILAPLVVFAYDVFRTVNEK